MVTVQILLFVALASNWEIHQIDIHNTLSHGDLTEEVYVHLPPGFHDFGPNQVFCLNKSLYGLRQAPHYWFTKLPASLISVGFVQSYANYSLFTYTKGGIFHCILIYVDDLLINGNICCLHN